VFLRHLVQAALEGGVLRAEGRGGVRRGRLLGVPQLAHQFTDPLALGEDGLLGAGEGFLGVECALAPGGFDALVLLLGALLTPFAGVRDGCLDEVSGVRVLVTEGGGHSGSLGDRADGESSAFAAELADVGVHVNVPSHVRMNVLSS
jgi:hypothetical protein